MGQNYSISTTSSPIGFLFLALPILAIFFWSPSELIAQDYPNPSHHFRADTLVTTVSGNVSAWQDIYNESVSFIQNTGVNRPQLTTNIYELDVVRFSGGNKILTLNTSIVPETIVILIKVDQFPVYARVIDRNVGNDAGIHLVAAGFQMRFDDDPDNRVVVGPALSELRMVSVTTSSATTLALARTFGNTSILGDNRNWPAGNYQFGLGTTSFNGDVVEIAFFDTELTEAEIIAYEQSRYDFYVAPPLLADSDTLITEDFCPVILDPGDQFESYQWQDDSVEQTFTATTEGWYWVQVSDFFGRELVDSVYVQYPGNYLSNGRACLGDSYTYDLGLPESSFQFAWSTGAETPSVELTQPGAYSVTITDFNDCIHEPEPFILEVDSLALNTAIEFTEPFCTGNALSVSAAESVIVNYAWSTGESSSTIIPQVEGIFSVEVENEIGCIGQDTVEISFAGTAPEVAFEASELCASNVVTFTDITVSVDGIVSWNWNLAGTSAEGPVAEAVFDAAGEYEVELQITFESGCIGSATETIIIQPSPEVGFEVPLICAGSEAVFEGIASIEGDAELEDFAWDFGNGQFGTGAMASVVFESPGEYLVSFSVSSSNNCVGNSEVVVEVSSDQIENPYFNAFCLGLSHMFRADTLVTAINGGVAEWRDIFDPELSFVQNTAANRPVYTQNEFELDVVDFSPGNRGMVMNGPVAPQTMVILLKVNQFPAYSRIIDGNVGNDSGIHLGSAGFQARFDDLPIKRTNFGVAENDLTFVSVATSNGVNQAIARAFGTDTVLGSDRNWINSNYIIGGGAFAFNGELVEISIFDTELSADELAFYENERMDFYVAPLNLAENDTINALNFCGTEIDAGERFSNYLWSDGATSQTIIAEYPGWYTVLVTDFFGRQFEDSVYINYPGNFQTETAYLCIGDTSVFDIQLSEEHYTFMWSTGAETPSIEVSAIGSFFVSVTDSLDCEYTSTPFDVVLDLFSEEVAISSPAPFCFGNVLSLGEFTAEIIEYIWSDGSEGPTFAPSGDGTYWVDVVSDNGCYGQDTVTIDYAGIAPVVSFTTDGYCEQTEITFEDLSTTEANDSIATVEWFINSQSFTGTSVSLSFPDAGIYSIFMSVEAASGCTGVLNDSIILQPVPDVAFIHALSCTGTSTLFEDESTISDGNISSWFWDFGNGETAVLPEASVVFNEPGIQNVALTVTSVLGCVSTLESEIPVYPSPVAEFVWSPTCQGAQMQFQSTTDTSLTGSLTYAWNFAGFVNSGITAQHEFSGAGEYPVTHEVWTTINGFPGCFGQSTQVVTVSPQPQLDFEHTIACAGDAFTITDLSLPGAGDSIVNRQWFFNGEVIDTTAAFSFTFSDPGDYTIVLAIETEAGCSGLFSQIIPVGSTEPPVFTVSPDVGAPPAAVQFVNTGSYGAHHIWDFGDGNTSLEIDPIHTYQDTGIYYPQLMVVDEAGCPGIAEGVFYAFEPYFDVSIEAIDCTDDNGQIAVSGVLGNFNNHRLTSAELRMWLGNGTVVSELWEGSLERNQLQSFAFTSRLNYREDIQADYLCVEIVNPNGNNTDAVPSNNKKCKSISTSMFALFPPFPNPADNEVQQYFHLAQAGEVHFRLVQSDGKVIEERWVNPGRGLHIERFQTASLAAGVYVLWAEFNGETVFNRIQIIR